MLPYAGVPARRVAHILARLGPCVIGPAVERLRVVRRGVTIDSHLHHDHAHRVAMARIAAGLPRWPVVQLTRHPLTPSGEGDRLQDTNASTETAR